MAVPSWVSRRAMSAAVYHVRKCPKLPDFSHEYKEQYAQFRADARILKFLEYRLRKDPNEECQHLLERAQTYLNETQAKRIRDSYLALDQSAWSTNERLTMRALVHHGCEFGPISMAIPLRQIEHLTLVLDLDSQGVKYRDVSRCLDKLVYYGVITVKKGRPCGPNTKSMKRLSNLITLVL